MSRTPAATATGISIATINRVFLCVCVLLSLMLLGSSVFSAVSFKGQKASEARFIAANNAALDLNEGSDVLTGCVQHYVATGDPVYMDAYFREVDSQRRQLACATLLETHTDPEIESYCLSAMEKSVELESIEHHAMALTALANGSDLAAAREPVATYPLTREELGLTSAQMLERARDLVFGDLYHELKSAIDSDIEQFCLQVTSRELQAVDSLSERVFLSIILCIVAGVLLAIAIAAFFCTLHRQVVVPLSNAVKAVEGGDELAISGTQECRYLSNRFNERASLAEIRTRQLKHRAEHDALTGLVNRGSFESQINEIAQNSATKDGAFLLIDIDHFKLVNDTYGHQVGDLALQRLAQVLVETFRQADIIARLGGDEFAVWLIDATQENCSFVFDRLQGMNEVLGEPLEDCPAFSLSAGCAIYTSGDTFDSLYAKADRTLYASKDGGRARLTMHVDDAQ